MKTKATTAFCFVLLVTILALYWALFYPYHFFFKEQIQLFQITFEYFETYLHKPAWLIRYLNDFFTQFYYFRFAGPIILAVILALEWWLITLIINQKNKLKGFLIALIPIAFEFSLHYTVEYTLVHTLGNIFCLTLAVLMMNRKFTKWHTILLIPALCITYWLIGVYAYPAILLTLMLMDISFCKGALLLGISMITIVALSVYTRLYSLLTISQTVIYPAQTIEFLIPTFAIAALALTIKIRNYFKISIPLSISVTASFLSLLLIIGWGIMKKSAFDFEKILSLDTETYLGNSNRLEENTKKITAQNFQITYFENLANAQKNLMPERLLSIYQPAALGLFLPVDPNSSVASIIFSNEVFYRLGDMNMAQHSSMLGMTFLPSKRSSRLVRRLAEINMVIGEEEAAKKYLKMLIPTLVHRKWALEQLQYLNPDQAMKPTWLIEKQKYLPKTDTIRTSYDYAASLEILLKSNPHNKMALDYLLCYHLLNKNLSGFCDVLMTYKDQVGIPLPRIYAQALTICKAINKTESFPFNIPQDVLRDYKEYTNIYTNSDGDGSKLIAQFGETYWFYYHFAQINSK